MSNTPFSNPDQFTKDLAGILQNMQKSQPDPLPAELRAAADKIKTDVQSARTAEDATSLMKNAVNAASKESGKVYSNQDLINFERQVRGG